MNLKITEKNIQSPEPQRVRNLYRGDIFCFLSILVLDSCLSNVFVGSYFFFSLFSPFGHCLPCVNSKWMYFWSSYLFHFIVFFFPLFKFLFLVCSVNWRQTINHFEVKHSTFFRVELNSRRKNTKKSHQFIHIVIVIFHFSFYLKLRGKKKIILPNVQWSQRKLEKR